MGHLWYEESVVKTVEDNCSISHIPFNVLVAVSERIWPTKLCSNNSLYNGHKTVVVLLP